MAARRLVAVMLVLLFLSSLAAALAPQVEEPEEETSTTEQTQTTPVGPAPGEGALLEADLDADAKRPRTIKAQVGDQLQLRVTGSKVRTVELPNLGPTEDVGPRAPAHFDLLLDRPGDFEIRLLESRRTIGSIAVRKPGESNPGAPKERAPDGDRGRP